MTQSSPNYRGHASSVISDTTNRDNEVLDENDPFNILRKLRIKNLNRLIIGHLNINYIRNKFETFKMLIQGNVDIAVITESKLDQSFPAGKF